MKRIVASVGLVALGTAGVQGVYGQTSLLADTSKPWSVSSALRGFYDDNVNTVSQGKVHTFGYELNPSIAYGIALDQTQISANYAYSFKYYEKRPANTEQKDDQTHTFGLLLNHAFNERLKVAVEDSFVIGQEADTLRVQGAPFSQQNRISGNNIRNYGSVVLDDQVTREFGVQVGYANTFFEYADNTPFLEFGPPGQPSNAGLLNRVENNIHLDLRWTLNPDTTVLVGYMFGLVQYIGNQQIGNQIPSGTPLFSESRNGLSHYGYVGFERAWTPDLSSSIRVGVRYTDYYNTPTGQTDTSPYVASSLRWTYTKESYAELGTSHDRSTTDTFSVSSNNSITTDTDVTVAYLSIRHRILPNLYGTAIGTFQYSKFVGGQDDGQTQKFYEGAVGLEYKFDRHFSAEAGYDYDKFNSDVAGQNYTRNRVYIGLSASY